MTSATDELLNLERIREELIRQEETIIFALIERAQWAQNKPTYVPGAIELPSSQKDSSFLDFFFCETEKVHALVRRYTSPDEYAFYPDKLPQPVLPLLDFPQVLKPNNINLNPKILSLYLTKIIPSICAEGDDKQYGSSANADISALQALSKRIHYGKFVAESKFRASEEEYKKLIMERNSEGILQLLTNAKVEEQLLKRVLEKASTYGKDINLQPNEKVHFKIKPEEIVALYRDYIIPLTKEVQVRYLLERVEGCSVAYLGPAGSFSHAAAQQFQPESPSTQHIACRNIHEVFGSVLSNKCLFGIVPFENSTTGIVHPHLELLISHPTKVCAELYIPIRFSFASLHQNPSKPQIKRIYSHPQGFQQCQAWISTHFPEAERVPMNSTSQAAEAASKDEESAALASLTAGNTFGLKIVQPDVQDSPNNMTRFLVIAKAFGRPSGNDKTMVTFGVSNTPGSLLNALAVFKERNINLTSIQSYPDKVNPFQYCFFIEMEGHSEDESLTGALQRLKDHTTFENLIGSFPKAGNLLLKK